jgi:hypothetical protein
MKQALVALALPLLLAASLYATTPTDSTAAFAGDVRVDLTHVDAGKQMSRRELIRRAMRRSKARAAALSVARSGNNGRHAGKSADEQQQPGVAVRPSGDLEYLVDLAIGTPPQPVSALLDTGSDLIWTQCAPCGSQCFKQPGPLYNPSSSTTFGVLPCNSSASMCAALAGPSPPPGCSCMYNQTYGTGWTAGIQSVETFTFGSTPADQARVPGIAFGCSNASSDDWNGSSGLVGLGRGSMSLVSQLGAGMFSYCLTPFQDTNSTSTLLLGPAAALNGTGVRSTPFVASPSKAPMSTYYYLNLTGISVGTTALSIPPNTFA